MRLTARLQKLEQQVAPQAARMWQVWVHEGETEAAAMARQGVTPGPQDLVVLIACYGGCPECAGAAGRDRPRPETGRLEADEQGR